MSFVLKRENILVPAILLVGAFLLFSNTFGNTWTYDDFPVLVENTDIRSLSAFLQDSYPGRPLREMTYLLDYALFGLNPAGYHIQNIFWHGLNAWLIFALVRRLQGSSRVAWIASLLFLVHPLQVEVVANISHRKDSLALAFCLLGMLAYTRVFTGGQRSFRWLVAACGLTLVALLAKQNAVGLPLVFGAYELAFVPREQRVLLKCKSLLWALLAIGAGVLGWLWFAGLQSAYANKVRELLLFKANYDGEVSFGNYYLMVLKSWAFIFLKFLVPHDLAVEYTYQVPSTWSDPWVLAALSGLFSYAFGLWFSLRHSPRIFFALVWVGVFWLPVSNLWPLVYWAADRYLYAPAAGLVILAAVALDKVFCRQAILAAVVGCIAVFLSVSTVRQNLVWRSEETLWRQAYRVSPSSSFALNNLGNIYLLSGEMLKSKEFYEKSVAVNSLNPTAYYNLGLIYERTGQKDKALSYYQKFLKINSPAYQSQAQNLRQRLRLQYGVVLN